MLDLLGLGEYERGLDIAARTVPLLVATLPDTSVDRLLGERTRAVLLDRMGDEHAAAEAAETYAAFLRRFGPTHEHTLAALVCLGNATKNPREATKFLDSAFRGYRQKFGDDHPFTLFCLVNKMIVDPDGSVDASPLDQLTEALGPSHPATLCAANTHTTLLSANHRLPIAIALGEETHERSRLALGEHHPHTLACVVNLALDLERAGDRRWRQLIEQTTEELIEFYGFMFPHTRRAMSRMRIATPIDIMPT
jgi:hypothetical protein